MRNSEIKENLKISARNYARIIFVWFLALISYSLVTWLLINLFKLSYGWLILLTVLVSGFVVLTIWPFYKLSLINGWGNIEYISILLQKRVFDLCVSLPLLLLLSPVLLLVSLLVKLDSPGPVLYKSRRIGLYERQFFSFYFRTRYIAESTESEKQTRYPYLGRLLRMTSLYTLPQIYNVARGDMSLVGPIPLHPEHLVELSPEQHERFKFLPGLISLWPISHYGESDLEFQDMLAMDIEYINNWSIFLDVKLMLLAPYVVLFNK